MAGFGKWLWILVLALAVLGLSASLSSAEAPKLGILGTANDGGGIRITQVNDGSVADQMGLQTDWVIISVNGMFIKGHPDMRAAMDAATSHIKLIVDTGSGYDQYDADLAQPYSEGKAYKVSHVKHKKVSGPN